MLAQGYSVNLYMFEGGTSFGFMNGANFQGGPVRPLRRPDHQLRLRRCAGRSRSAHGQIRPCSATAIAKATGRTPPPLPAPTPFMTLPAITLGESASLWDNLPTPIAVEQPAPMEQFGQDYGYILYRTQVERADQGHALPGRGARLCGDLSGPQPRGHGRASAQAGDAADRRSVRGTHTLDILVENTGRINYGPHLADGRAGLVDPVWLAGAQAAGLAGVSAADAFARHAAWLDHRAGGRPGVPSRTVPRRRIRPTPTSTSVRSARVRPGSTDATSGGSGRSARSARCICRRRGCTRATTVWWCSIWTPCSSRNCAVSSIRYGFGRPLRVNASGYRVLSACGGLLLFAAAVPVRAIDATGLQLFARAGCRVALASAVTVGAQADAVGFDTPAMPSHGGVAGAREARLSAGPVRPRRTI